MFLFSKTRRNGRGRTVVVEFTCSFYGAPRRASREPHNRLGVPCPTQYGRWWGGDFCLVKEVAGEGGQKYRVHSQFLRSRGEQAESHTTTGWACLVQYNTVRGSS